MLILTGEPGAASAALVRKAEETAGKLADLAKAGDTGKAQIRAIFDELRHIEALWLSDSKQALHRVYLLKPKMAYRASREQRLAPLVDVLSPALDVVVQDPGQVKRRFARLVELGEAILAYYTAKAPQGGRR